MNQTQRRGCRIASQRSRELRTADFRKLSGRHMAQLLGSRRGTDGICFLALGVGLGSKPTFSENPLTLLQRFKNTSFSHQL